VNRTLFVFFISLILLTLFWASLVLANDVVNIFGPVPADSAWVKAQDNLIYKDLYYFFGWHFDSVCLELLQAENDPEYDSLETEACGIFLRGTNIHTDVIDVPEKFNGYRKILGWTPLPEGQTECENPHLAASQTGMDWKIPSGLSNPIDSPTGWTYLSDIDITCYDDTLWCIYRGYKATERAIMVKWVADWSTTGSRDTLWHRTSGFTEDPVSPSYLVDEDDSVRIYYIDGTGDPRVMRYRKSDHPGGTFGDSVSCVLTVPDPDNRDGWHINMEYIGKYYIGLLVTATRGTGGSAAQLHLIYSTDGDTFKTITEEIVDVSASEWDDSYIYRAGFLPRLREDGSLAIEIWYPGVGTGGKDRHMGHTEVSFYPQAVEVKKLDKWFVSVHDAEDSLDVFVRQWEYGKFDWIEFQNNSGTDDQYDTVLFTAIMPEGERDHPDTHAVTIDSMRFTFRTSSTTTTISSVEFIVSCQNGYGADTVEIYESNPVASTVADTWRVLSVTSSIVQAAIENAEIQVWVIARLDTDEDARVEGVELYYEDYCEQLYLHKSPLH